MIEPFSRRDLLERKYKGLARGPSRGTRSETANYQIEVVIEGVSANCMNRGIENGSGDEPVVLALKGKPRAEGLGKIARQRTCQADGSSDEFFH